ncbi:MAG: helix-turn-helix domain-containing protein, partial [Candidatus Nitrosopolaris sp.]
MNHSSKLKLVIGQRNSLKSIMKTTHNEKQYRRLLAILQKVKGRTYEDIANEHGVSNRSVQRWVTAYIHDGIEEVKLK